MQDDEENEPYIEGEAKIMDQIRALSRSGAFRSLIDLCAEYQALGGHVLNYGPYLYPALLETGDFDEALRISVECADDQITPVDQLKILFRAGRSERVLRLATSIIEDPMWFDWTSVVESLLMRAETYRRDGQFLQAWEDVKSAYGFVTERKLSLRHLKDISAVSRLIRMESARPFEKSKSVPSCYVPKLVGGPTCLGQSSN